MKNIIKILVLLIISLFIFVKIDYVSATSETDRLIDSTNKETWTVKNDLLKDFWKDDGFIKTKWVWQESIYWSMINIAKDLKNLFFWLATIFFIIIVFRLLFADKADDELSKFKKGIIWITLWLIIMQIAFVYTEVLYNKEVWEELAFGLIESIINPFIWLLEVLAAMFFLAIAIYAFFRLITANGDEAKIKEWKMSIVYAIIWYLIIKIAKIIVTWVYGVASCWSSWYVSAWSTTCQLEKANLSDFGTIMLNIINRTNSFVAIVVIVMVIYVWGKILLSRWDEEALKSSKNIILYIIIWLFLLVLNYLILTFFIIPQNNF